MCISAATNSETGVTLSLHLSHGTACLSLDEAAVAHLLTFIQAPLLFPAGTIRLDACGHYPALAGHCSHGNQFTVTGMTVVRSAEGYALHANLNDDSFGRPDIRTPPLYTVPVQELHRLLTSTGNH